MVPPLPKLPTASHDDAVLQEMPLSWPAPGSGMLTIVQVLPLRLSASRLLAFPTAMQEVVDAQETAVKSHTDAPEGAGVLCCSQLAAAGCAITSTADIASAAVTTNRFIAIVTPRSSMVRCRGRAAMLMMARIASPNLATRRGSPPVPAPNAGTEATVSIARAKSRCPPHGVILTFPGVLPPMSGYRRRRIRERLIGARWDREQELQSTWNRQYVERRRR